MSLCLTSAGVQVNSSTGDLPQNWNKAPLIYYMQTLEYAQVAQSFSDASVKPRETHQDMKQVQNTAGGCLEDDRSATGLIIVKRRRPAWHKEEKHKIKHTTETVDWCWWRQHHRQTGSKPRVRDFDQFPLHRGTLTGQTTSTATSPLHLVHDCRWFDLKEQFII